MLNGGAVTVNPPFSSVTYDYTANIAETESLITVTAFKADANSSVIFNPAQPSSLVIGVNTITIRVTAQSGAEKTYTIIVDRAGDYNDIIGTINLELKFIPSGYYQDSQKINNISAPFRISEKEITRQQFLDVMGSDPSNTSYSQGLNNPVQQVSWYKTIVFCNKLSKLKNLTPVYSLLVNGSDNTNTDDWGAIPTSSNPVWNAVKFNLSATGYRLPTKIEWIWAAMGAYSDSKPGDILNNINTGGYTKNFSGSNGSNTPGPFAVFGYLSGELGCTTTNTTNAVGSKTSNELGLFDMTGNVYEWCWDSNDTFLRTRIYHGVSFHVALSTRTVSTWGEDDSFDSLFFIGFRVVRR